MTGLTYKSPKEHLQKLREEWLLSDEAAATLKGEELFRSSSCLIDSKTWRQEIYLDFSGAKKFVVFEVSRKSTLCEEHHCLGCEIVQDNYSLITNEQLWEEGIP